MIPTISKEVRTCRVASDMSLRRLAELSGIRHVELSHIEREVREATAAELDAIRRAIATETTGDLPPELAEHQREVKAEIKALYQQRHGRDTLLQMRAELLALPDPVDEEDADGRAELLAWMDEKLDALNIR